MRAAKIVLILSLALGGCSFMGAKPQEPAVLRVEVPVPVACAPALPSKPPLTLYMLPKGSGAVATLKNALVDLWTIEQYADELRALLAGCNSEKVKSK